MPSGLRYHPSNAGVTVWPLVFGTERGSCRRGGGAAAVASAASPRDTDSQPTPRARIADTLAGMRNRGDYTSTSGAPQFRGFE